VLLTLIDSLWRIGIYPFIAVRHASQVWIVRKRGKSRFRALINYFQNINLCKMYHIKNAKKFCGNYFGTSRNMICVCGLFVVHLCSSVSSLMRSWVNDKNRKRENLIHIILSGGFFISRSKCLPILHVFLF